MKVIPWRYGKGFWGFAFWISPNNNPVFSIAKTPKVFAISLFSKTYLKEKE